jgi:hypothetical protein
MDRGAFHAGSRSLLEGVRPMTVGEARYALLSELAWELHGLPVGSCLTVPVRGEPVLFVPRAYGKRLSVLAAQRKGGWWLLWDGEAADARRVDLAARRIAAAVR